MSRATIKDLKLGLRALRTARRHLGRAYWTDTNQLDAIRRQQRELDRLIEAARASFLEERRLLQLRQLGRAA